MIWTVILKNGGSLVIHGDSFDRDRELRKVLKAQKLRKTSVAGIVKGEHTVEAVDQPVEMFNIPNFSHKEFNLSIKVAPEFDNLEIADETMDRIIKLSSEPIV